MMPHRRRCPGAGAGFTGIAVSLIGRNHPAGIVLASLLFGALYQGGAEVAFEMPGFSRDMIGVLQGFIVLCCGAMAYVAAPGEMPADMVMLLRWASWVLSIPVMVFAAGPFFRGAWRGLRERRISMDLPVALGIAVTFVASSAATFDAGGPFGSEVYFDSLTMFVFFLLCGRYLEMMARQKAVRGVEEIARVLPAFALRRPSARVTEPSTNAMMLAERPLSLPPRSEPSMRIAPCFMLARLIRRRART